MRAGTAYKIILSMLALGGVLIPALVAAQDDPFEYPWRWTEHTVESGLPGEVVDDITESRDGVPWVITAKGVAWFDGFRWIPVGMREWEWTRSREGRLVESRVKPHGDRGVLVVFAGKLYTGDQGGFERVAVAVDGDTLTVHDAVSLGPSELALYSQKGLYRLREGRVEPWPSPPADGLARQGLAASAGVLWLATGEGVFAWIGQKWVPHLSFQSSLLRVRGTNGILGVNHDPGVNGLWTWSGAEPPVRLGVERGSSLAALDINSAGDIVAVQRGGGVWTRRAGEWSALKSTPVPLREARSVSYQSNGDLWVAGDRGLFHFRGAEDRWSAWRHGDDDWRSHVNAVLRSSRGDFWLGTNDGLVVRRASGEVDRTVAINGRALGVITSLAEDSSGAVWVSSGADFEGAYRSFEGRWRHFGPADGLRAERVHKIVADHEGDVWFLSIGVQPQDGGGPGAFRYDGERFHPWGTAQGLLDDRAYTVAKDTNGVLWFGTRSGLSRWSSGEWTHWDTLRPYEIALDEEGRPWFGEQDLGRGLGTIDAQDSLRYLTVEDGLADPRVWNVAIAKDGRIWAATPSGLMTHKEGTFSVFGRRSGIPFRGLWPLVLTDDSVYAGARLGLLGLSLEEGSNPPPRVSMLTPLVSGDEVFARWRADAYRGEQAASMVETRYSLDGGAWSRWSTARETSIRGVNPGEHVLEVQAKSLFGVVGADGTTASFIITPPWYRTPPALLGMGVWLLVLVGGGVYAWRRVRLHRARIEESERKYRSLVDNSPGFVCSHSVDGELLAVNGAASRLLDYEPNEMVGRQLLDFLEPGCDDAYARYLARVRERGFDEGILHAQTRTGETRVWRYRNALLEDLRDGPTVVGHALDVTDFLRTESALDASEDRYRRLVEALPICIHEIDLDGRIQSMNPAGLAMLGLASDEDARGTSYVSWVPEADRAEIEAALDRAVLGTPCAFEFETSPGSEESIVLSSVVLPIRDELGRTTKLMGYTQDITDRRRAEEESRRLETQLRQSQKMEAIGQLAGGVAHDFNNLLTVIGWHADIIAKEPTRIGRVAKGAEEIVKAHERASSLTQQLLAFGSRQTLQPRVLALSQVVENLESLLRRLIGVDIHLDFALDSRVAHVRVDERQMEQVIINLVINARDAVSSGGRITLSTRPALVTAPLTTFSGAVMPGRYTVLEVRDNGQGMDKSTVSRIFEPFFTTKEQGKGTGLGLSTVHGIVLQSAGSIQVESVPNRGSVFRVYLPAAEEALDAAPEAEDIDEEPRGSATVLVVEDDAAIRIMLVEGLEEAGYAVVAAENGQEALKLARAAEVSFDLLLTDVVMPLMNGHELARHMWQFDPDLPVVYMSGYVERVIAEQLELAAAASLIEKPFTLPALGRAIQEALERRTAGPKPKRAAKSA